MPIARPFRRGLVRAAFVTFSLALAAVLVNTVAPPHTHASVTPAVFNEDHDLSALATVGSGTGLLPQVPSVTALVTVLPLADGPRQVALGAAAHRSAGSRAPPVL